MGVNLGRSPTVKNKIAAFETKCYRKILRISWIKKVTNAAILRELNVKENWLNNMVFSRKLQYFGHIKRHDSLEKTIMEGMVPGRRARGKARRRGTQDIKDHLNMTVTEAGRLAQDRQRFLKSVMTATSCSGYAT